MTQQDIIYPPPLFETPADGWIAWVMRLMADQQQDFTPPGMETIFLRPAHHLARPVVGTGLRVG